MRIKKRVQGTEDRLFRTRIGYPNHLRVMRKIQSLEDYYRAGPSSEKLLIDTENISNALAWAWRHVPVDTLLEKLKQGDLELCACARTCVVLTHALRKDGPSHVCECPPPPPGGASTAQLPPAGHQPFCVHQNSTTFPVHKATVAAPPAPCDSATFLTMPGGRGRESLSGPIPHPHSIAFTSIIQVLVTSL